VRWGVAGELFWGMIASMWIGNLMLVVINLPLVGVWVSLLRVPYRQEAMSYTSPPPVLTLRKIMSFSPRLLVDHSGCDRMDSSSLAWAISGSSILSIASSAVTSRPSHSCFQASCLWPLSLFCHRSLRSLA